MRAELGLPQRRSQSSQSRLQAVLLWAIAPGPDGNLWFTEESGNKIGRITPSGQITEYPVPTEGSDPHGITAGPDGSMWFTEGLANKIGQITPSGRITEFPIPGVEAGPAEIAAGPDGNLWFTEGNRIGRITPSGQITSFPLAVRKADERDHGGTGRQPLVHT